MSDWEHTNDASRQRLKEFQDMAFQSRGLQAEADRRARQELQMRMHGWDALNWPAVFPLIRLDVPDAAPPLDPKPHEIRTYSPCACGAPAGVHCKAVEPGPNADGLIVTEDRKCHAFRIARMQELYNRRWEPSRQVVSLDPYKGAEYA